MGNAGATARIADLEVNQADQQHLAWLSRSFGSSGYAPLSVKDLNTLISVAEVVAKYPGAHLFREGEEASAVFMVETGEVEVYRGFGPGRSVVSRVGPGSVLGDIAMFGRTPHIASTQAVTRLRVFSFERDRLLTELARNPAISLRWLLAGIRQLEGTQRRVLHLMHKTVLGQVADLLGEEADDRGDVHLSQTTIATLLGVSDNR